MPRHDGEVRTAWGLRVGLAAMVAISAVAHLQVWQEGMHNVAVVGPLFLLQGVAGLVLAVLLVAWRSRLTLLAAVGFGAATLVAFVIATTPVGLLGVHSRWTGTPEWTSAITEAATVVLGLFALRAERTHATRPG
ncbi:MAG: hypothetical protein L6367_16065 [Cellulomonas sp.]|nr:hypothetical protein [Cellulomonas sp.]